MGFSMCDANEPTNPRVETPTIRQALTDDAWEGHNETLTSGDLDAIAAIAAKAAFAITVDHFDAFLPSPQLDPAWIAGWHSAVKHVAAVLAKQGCRTAVVPFLPWPERRTAPEHLVAGAVGLSRWSPRRRRSRDRHGSQSVAVRPPRVRARCRRPNARPVSRGHYLRPVGRSAQTGRPSRRCP